MLDPRRSSRRRLSRRRCPRCGAPCLRNSHGRIERNLFRYVARRYFMQQSALLIWGLKPTRKLNGSDAGSAQILGEAMPGLVETVLGAKHVEDHGSGM